MGERQQPHGRDRGGAIPGAPISRHPGNPRRARDGPRADTAIFHMGLVYAHPKNPKKDNKRAIYFFNRVIKGYPDSAWVEQAKIWVGVLDGVEKLKQVDLEIEERKRDRR